MITVDAVNVMAGPIVRSNTMYNGSHHTGWYAIGYTGASSTHNAISLGFR
jgi:hypothetical protein